jgi:hypothetical protein
MRRRLLAVPLAALVVACVADPRLDEVPPSNGHPTRPVSASADGSVSVETAGPSSASVDLGASGSVVVVRTDEQMVVTPRPFANIVPGFCCLQDAFWLGPDGTLVALVQMEAEETSERLLRLDLADPGSEARLLPAGSPTFLAGGTIVVNGDETTVFDAEHPEGATLTLPFGVTVGGATADRTRLLGLRAREAPGLDLVLEPVVIGRDGGIGPWLPDAGVALTRGAERPFGAAGESAGVWFDDGPAGGSSGLNVVPAGGSGQGRNIAPDATGVSSWAWTPDGRGAVMLARDAIYSWSGGPTTRVRDLPPAPGGNGQWEIVGLTTDAVILSTRGGTMTVVPDAGGEPRTISGTLVAVVP